MIIQKTKPISPEKFKVKRTKLPPWPMREEDMSELGRKLMKIVAEIDASDDPPMSEEDLERRLQMGRGGFIRDDQEN